MCTFLQELLLTAKKLIAKQWKQAGEPILYNEKVKINKTLPYKKLIYDHREA